jgi:hypothetical protein
VPGREQHNADYGGKSRHGDHNLVDRARPPVFKSRQNTYRDTTVVNSALMRRLSGGRSNRVAAYQATLYYMEIIALMFALLFLYGKLASIIAGIVLSAALTYHVIQLYFGKKQHRMVQLYIIDLHAAFAAGYLVYHALAGMDAGAGAALVPAMRALILASELPLLFLLTGSQAEQDRPSWTG